MQLLSDKPMIIKRSFANCVLDSNFHTLNTNTRIVRLRCKLFATFCCLVDNQNRLVTRKQLITECWNGNTFTGEKAVTHTICQLRKILKQNDINASITTLSKQGYVFSCNENHFKLENFTAKTKLSYLNP